MKKNDAKYTVMLSDINGKAKTVQLSELVRFYPANDLSFWGKMGVYFSRWAEFLTAEPREANTEGGVLPAIFGTFVHDAPHGVGRGSLRGHGRALSARVRQAGDWSSASCGSA